MATKLEINDLYPLAFNPGGTFSEGGRTVTFSVVTAGLLSLPSGRIVACDPLTAGRQAPFVQTVLPGRYAVDLALVQGVNSTEHVAMARIKFTKRQPEVWVMALLKGQSLAELSEGSFFGYRSDSGTGSFMDADAVSQADFANLEDIDSLLIELTANYKPQRYWLEYPLERRLNIVMFSSGRGEGSYPSYFGIDEAGDICTLVTDFELI
jgi:hypothetical protein